MEAVLFTKQDKERIERIERDVRSLKNREVPEILISQTEAARFLGVTKGTINRYIKIGRLKKRMYGGVSGILLADILKLSAKGIENPQ